MSSSRCVEWAEKYFNDCLRNGKDEISFSLGFVSLVCWGVAEVPQIITNFQTKSSHGVSLAFLLAWIAGDVFNLVGCVLEPATLPTQFYTALLYTVTTVLLVLQCVYYNYIRTWLKQRKASEVGDEERRPLNPKPPNSGTQISSSPTEDLLRPEHYFTSARSLAGSITLPFRSYFSGPSSLMGLNDDDGLPVLSNSRKRSAGYAAFLASAVGFPSPVKGLMEGAGREHTVYGQCLGWLMAVVYMGGRIPQIYLNVKRGSVEGLNPLMFVFALLANVTYVGSILVRNVEWEKIKANMPWLLDAVACVFLDLFILMQYVYYERITSPKEQGGDFNEADKLARP